MPEWLHEEGIGENRAILIDGGEIVEAAIELPGLRAGAIVPARLTRILIPGRRGVATLEGGEEAIVEPLPKGLTEGGAFRAEILREPIPETGRPKLAKARATDGEPKAGETLFERLGSGIRLTPFDPDRFEDGGWSELLDEAARGEIAFPGGALRMSVAPAMTLFDVDGSLPLAELAIAGAAAAARAIRRFGIGGSIGVDLPTVPDRTVRQKAAEAVDAILPQPFERTAVNGFGFLQIVRRRERPSVPEILQADPTGAAARALLRRAQRASGHGPLTLHAAPVVVAAVESIPGWREAIERAVGAPAALQGEPSLAISGSHVHRAH